MAFRREIDDFAYYEQNVFATFLWRNELFYFVAEENHADLVIVLNRRERKRRGQLCRYVFLGISACSEVPASADVHQQHHGQFAFFFIDFHVGAVVARSQVPVNVSYVVAGLILPCFRKHHPAPLESRVVFSGKNVLAQTSRLYLDLPDFAQKFVGIHWIISC